MGRCIEVDEVLEQIRKKLGIKSLSYLLEAERQIVDAIQSAPSIDIVFCRECKHRGICFGKLVQGIEVVQLNFCSYGEREGE